VTTLSGLDNRGFLFRFPSDARDFSLKCPGTEDAFPGG
jgi:hypothetical protein